MESFVPKDLARKKNKNNNLHSIKVTKEKRTNSHTHNRWAILTEKKKKKLDYPALFLNSHSRSRKIGL